MSIKIDIYEELFILSKKKLISDIRNIIISYYYSKHSIICSECLQCMLHCGHSSDERVCSLLMFALFNTPPMIVYIGKCNEFGKKLFKKNECIKCKPILCQFLGLPSDIPQICEYKIVNKRVMCYNTY